MTSSILTELDDLVPAGRALNQLVVAQHWAHRDEQRQAAARDVEAARKQLAHARARAQAQAPGFMPGAEGGDLPARRALEDAERRASQAQASVSELARQLRQEVAAGGDLWTVPRELSGVEAIDAEEHRDRSRHDAEAFVASQTGIEPEGPSAVEQELRATRRELQRLRQQLGAQQS